MFQPSRASWGQLCNHVDYAVINGFDIAANLPKMLLQFLDMPCFSYASPFPNPATQMVLRLSNICDVTALLIQETGCSVTAVITSPTWVFSKYQRRISYTLIMVQRFLAKLYVYRASVSQIPSAWVSKKDGPQTHLVRANKQARTADSPSTYSAPSRVAMWSRLGRICC